MDSATIALAATTAISILSTVLGLKFKQGKEKVTKLLTDVVNAVQDDTVTEEECKRIAADAKSFLEE
ncbi:MAG: hypothetical protein ACQCN6_03740 [Candidatus Bathyarchaeia archaeon]|jgi:hypothetical protein